MKLAGCNDPEGLMVPDGLPFIVDSHVHVFPTGLFKAIHAWFDQFAWPIRYRLTSEEVIQYLLSRGVGFVVAFQYAHKPGIAEALNTYMVGLCRAFPGKMAGMATVFPGEPGSAGILEKAFAAGLKGVKLHAHVQCFDMTDPDMEPVYETCQAENKPLVMHVSREPKSSAYNCDPYELCSAGKLETVLRRYPRLKICVPHLGIDEFEAYRGLVSSYDNLWLDTAMALADYFPVKPPYRLDEIRTERVLYGSDFPNIPYAWDRELKHLRANYDDPDLLRLVLADNARAFFDL